jgi:hypothetical protein
LRLGTTRKQLFGDRELAGVTVGKDGGRHDLDASFSKGVEHIASQISVVSKMASLVLVQARRWYSTEVPKCLFQDFGSWVGYDLLGSAGALDQASLLSSRIVSKLLLCKIQRSVDGRRACALSVWLERARLSKLLTNVVHVDFEANAVRGLAIP